jgi:hypothetical protein
MTAIAIAAPPGKEGVTFVPDVQVCALPALPSFEDAAIVAATLVVSSLMVKETPLIRFSSNKGRRLHRRISTLIIERFDRPKTEAVVIPFPGDKGSVLTTTVLRLGLKRSLVWPLAGIGVTRLSGVVTVELFGNSLRREDVVFYRRIPIAR